MTATQSQYSISDVPFFLQPDVEESITQVAESDRIVIFAGAGVTIDQTGVGWGHLIRTLLVDRDLVSDAAMPATLADTAVAHLAPIEAATILKELHTRRAGVRADSLIASAIGKKLYSFQPWLDGALASAVIDVAIQMCNKGGNVTIATTNYETLLEQRFLYERDVVGLAPKLQVSVQGKRILTHGALGMPGVVRLEYLHGRVTPEGVVDGQIALDELDYFNLRPTVARVLKNCCKDADMLIVGSSLSDPPLLSALWDTKDDGTKRRRVALMAMPAFGLDSPTPEIVADVRQLLATRMSAYGVELLSPDFFSQVSQYCTEVAASAQLSSGAVAEGYMQRLAKWWDEWSSREREVSKAHDIIVGALKNIRDELASPGHTGSTVKEVLRLEVWVRRDPVAPTRELTLWSTSAGVLTDSDVRRSAPLEVASQNVAVQAFASGKPTSQPAGSGARSSLNSRWKTYIATPVWISIDGRRVPVGAVTLSSLSDSARSRIDQDWSDRMSGVLSIMSTVGEQLLGVSGEWAAGSEIAAV